MTARDPRFLLAAILLLGYYGIILLIASRSQPIVNPDIVKDGMIVLGPPVGAVFASLFRSDSVDEQRAANTGEAFKALTAQANGTAAPTAVLRPGESAVAAGDTN